MRSADHTKRGPARTQGSDLSAPTLAAATSAATNLGLRTLRRHHLGRPTLGSRALHHGNLGHLALGCHCLTADTISAATPWPHAFSRVNLTTVLTPDAMAMALGSLKAPSHRDHHPAREEGEQLHQNTRRPKSTNCKKAKGRHTFRPSWLMLLMFFLTRVPFKTGIGPH